MKPTRTAVLSLLALPLFGCPSDSSSDTEAAGSGSSSGSPADSSGGPATTANVTEGSTSDASTTAVAEGTTAADGSGTSTGAASEGSGTAAEATGTTAAEGSSSGTTGAVELLPDLDLDVVAQQMTDSIFTQTLTFDDQSCPFLNGCLGGTGDRRLLRFSTWTPNVGNAAFHVGNPEDNPELFEMSACSGTYLFSNYASYRLLDGMGTEVGTGHKSAFALIDLQQWDDSAGPPHYGFGQDMGISVGWADIYDAQLDCQWVDITGIAAGDYTLELHVNPNEVVTESSYDNNILSIPVTITDDSDVPGPPDEWVCPGEWFGTTDGCDCGCGATDPDCPDMTADSCEYCLAPGCGNNSCMAIDPENNAVCVP